MPLVNGFNLHKTIVYQYKNGKILLKTLAVKIVFICLKMPYNFYNSKQNKNKSK